MSKWITSSAVFFAFVLGAVAQDESKKDSALPDAAKPSFSEQIKALQDELQSKQSKLMKRLSNVKSRKTMQALERRIDKLEESYAGRCLDLAEKFPKDPEVLPILDQLAMNSKAHSARAVDILLRQHVDSKAIGDICYRLAQDVENSVNLEKLCRGVLGASPHDDAKAAAALALARVLLARVDAATGAAAEKEKLLKEAEGVLLMVVEKYPKVRVPSPAVESETGALAGDVAKPGLFEIRHLQTGMPVPPLKGEDLDGKPFDLADYRGKVVVLYFWQFR